MTKESYNFGVDTEARLYTETSGMTDKRFTIPKGYRVIKNSVTDECATFYDNDDGETFLKWLNELHEENKELKKENAQFDILIKNNQLAYIDLEKENGQLKQFKEDVFNTIDMHLRMLPTARDNEFNEDDGDPSLYTGAIYMLETLKKELEE